MKTQIKNNEGFSNNQIYKKVLFLLEKYHLNGFAADLGCGNLNFTKKIARYFKHIWAVDLKNSVNHSQKIDFLNWDLNKTQKIPIPKQDVVIGIEIIEHLENPRNFIRQVKNLLKNGGTLLLSTPNNHSLRAKINFILADHFPAFKGKEYPKHITPIIINDFLNILKENNFSEIKIFYSDWGIIPKMFGLTWQKISFGLLRGKLFSDNVIFYAKRS